MAIGRRAPNQVPTLIGRTWNDVTRELWEYLDRLQAGFSGLPAPHSDTHTGGGPGDPGVDTLEFADSQNILANQIFGW